MRNYIFCAVMWLGLGCGHLGLEARADEALTRLDGDVLARIHFAGTTALSAKPDAAHFKDTAALPVSQELLKQTLDKLSTTPFRALNGKLAAGSTDHSAELRPLLEDLLSNEFYLEMRGATNGIPELMLAVHLENSRAQAWQDTLARVLSSWTAIAVKPISSESYSGWELKKHVEPNLIRCLRAGDWLLFGWGQDDLKLQPVFLQNLKLKRRPADAMGAAFLDAAVDWPEFERNHKLGLPSYLPRPLPKMHLTVEMYTNFLRPRLVMDFPKPLNIKLDPWQIPINTIRNPIVSFSAVRGIQSWLQSLPQITALNPPSVPNQVSVWARDGAPFQTMYAMPVPGPSNYLERIQAPLVGNLNQWVKGSMFGATFGYSHGQIAMNGMPMLSPYLTSMHESTGDYLTAGFFLSPPDPHSKPIPAELVKEVYSKPNMVSYNWEINQARLVQWRSLIRTFMMVRGLNTPEMNQPAQKWIEETKNRFGNCATEITQTAPNELSLLRNAPIGLTGLEMNLLALWLDAPNFPLSYDYGKMVNPLLNPPSKHLPGKTGSAPPAPPK